MTEAMIWNESLCYVHGDGVYTYSEATVCRRANSLHAWTPYRTCMVALHHGDSQSIETRIVTDERRVTAVRRPDIRTICPWVGGASTRPGPRRDIPLLSA